MELDERGQETFFSEKNIIDLWVDIGGECQVEHGDEGLLHAWLAFDEGVAVDRSCDSLEDGVEELGVEAADVAQSDCRTRLQRLIELRGLPLLVAAAEVLRRTEEDGQEMVDRLEGRELLAGGVRLSAYVLEGLACIEPHDVIFRLVLSIADSQAAQDHLGCFVGELPHGVDLLVVQLCGSVEHVLAECGDCLPPHFLVLLLHRLDQLLADLRLGEFILDHSRMPDQQANDGAESALNAGCLNALEHLGEQVHES